MTFLNDLASVSITRANVTPSRAGFGTPMIAVYHTLNADRVRTYSSLAAMSADGFRSHDAAYRAAAACFAQTPRPRRIKVGRRASAPTQVIRLTPTTPSAGEVYALRVNGLDVSVTADGTPTVAEVCTALQAAIAGLADVDAIVATGASSASPQTVTGAALDGVVGWRTMATARHITLTLSADPNWDSTTAVLAGRDVDGNAITENLAIPNNGSATLKTTKRFRSVTSLTIPAQSGSGGTYTLGVAAPTVATDNTTHVTCTSTAGDCTTFELVSTSLASTGVFNLSLLDVSTDPGIAADLAAIHAADADYYALLLPEQLSAATAAAAAAHVETLRRILVLQTSDALVWSASSVNDIAFNLKASGFVRSSAWAYPHLGLATGQLAAAVVGRCLPLDAGSVTLAHKELAGVTVVSPTETQRSAIEGKNANHYSEVGDGGNTFPGKSCEGEFIDVVRDIDRSYERLQTAVLSVLRSNDKIPFTDDGIDAVGNAIRGALRADVTDGIYASFSVSTPAASAVSSADKAARSLTGVTFSATLAGAVHTTNITGTVSV